METYGQNKCLLYAQENATRPVITWVIQHFLCLFWGQPAALSHYAEGRICFSSPPSIFLIFIRQPSSPQEDQQSWELNYLSKRNEREVKFVRELGKKSGIKDQSVARLQHNEVWTQPDSTFNYGKQWLCRMEVSQLLPGLPVLRCSS